MFDLSPKTSGQVFRNSKTKVYSDGTTNTIVANSPIFKDSSIVSVEPEIKLEEKFELLNLSRLMNEDKIDKYYEFLESKYLKSYEVSELIRLQDNADFMITLSQHGLNLDDWDYITSFYKKPLPQSKTKSDNDPRDDSVKRAKDSIFDYVLNNDFDYFFTGTVDPAKLNSKDPKELLRPVTKWLKNMVLHYGMSYLMIAERHKKGGIHFHGLLKCDTLRLEDSGTKLYKGHKRPISDDKAAQMNLEIYEGRTVYNLASWRFGFSTCIKLTGDRMNTAFYITKYITKDCRKIFGKFFWHSRDLKKPQIVVEDMDFEAVDSIERNGFKYIFNRSNVKE